MLTSLETYHSSSIGAELIHSLTNNFQTKLSEELENADLNTFIFSKVRNFDTLQPVSASFDKSKIILRDCFEMDIYHPKESQTEVSVEILLLLDKEKTDLAICSLEYPGRALMFPSFRQGDIVFNKMKQTSRTTITLNCCACSNPKNIILYSSDESKINSWRWKFSQLFAFDYSTSRSEKNSKSTADGLGIIFGTPAFSTPERYSFLTPPSSAMKRLTLPLTPSLIDQLKEFLDPDFDDSDIVKPASKLPSVSSDERLKQAQQARKEIGREIFQKEQKLIQFRRQSESEETTNQQLLTPESTPPKNKTFQRKPVNRKPVTNQESPMYLLDGMSNMSIEKLASRPSTAPPEVPLPTPTSEKRRLVLSPSDETSIISNEKRPLLSTSRETSPSADEKEVVRTRTMLQSRAATGGNRLRDPRAVASMYVLGSGSDSDQDMETNEIASVAPLRIPRSNSDNNNASSLSLPIAPFKHNVSSPYTSPKETRNSSDQNDDEEFQIRSPAVPLATPTKFNGTSKFVRKVSGSLKKMMKKGKTPKMQFDILNLTPPLDDDKLERENERVSTPSMSAAATSSTTPVMAASTPVVDVKTISTHSSPNVEITNSFSPKIPTAVYENSNNSTVESGSLSSISARSLPRSNQSSSNSIQVDKVPDCSVQEFWNRKKAENGSIKLFEGKALISKWEDGNWVSLTDNREFFVQVNINGEGATIIAGPVVGITVMELNLLPSHEIRRSTVHDIQVKSPNRTTMFRIKEVEAAEVFWAAIRKDFKNQPLFNGIAQSQASGPPSLNDRDSSLGSLSSALANQNMIQYQQFTLRPPLISSRSGSPSPISGSPTSVEFPLRLPSSLGPNNRQSVISDNAELLLLNNLRCKLIQKEDDGKWQEEGQLARLSIFSVPTSSAKSILIRGTSNLADPLICEKDMKHTSFERIGKVGISICLTGQTEIEVSNLLQFKGEKEATYVYELLTNE